MESRFQFVFLMRRWGILWLLALCQLLLPWQSHAQALDALETEPMVVREPERRDIDVAKLDRSNFGAGLFAGVLQVEDFGAAAVYGVRLEYQITENLFLEGVYALSELGYTSFESLTGTNLLTSEQRDLRYYNLSVGYAVLPGEGFIASKYAFKTDFYLIAGTGSTEFAGDERFTWNAGVGYRLVLKDWLALRIDLRDHMFRSDLLGTSKVMHNLELTLGFGVHF